MYLHGMNFAQGCGMLDAPETSFDIDTSFEWEISEKGFQGDYRTRCAFNTECPTATPWYMMKKCSYFLVVDPKDIRVEFFRMPWRTWDGGCNIPLAKVPGEEHAFPGPGRRVDPRDDPSPYLPNEAWYMGNVKYTAFYFPMCHTFSNGFYQWFEHKITNKPFSLSDLEVRQCSKIRSMVLRQNAKLDYPIKKAIYQDVFFYKRGEETHIRLGKEVIKSLV